MASLTIFRHCFRSVCNFPKFRVAWTRGYIMTTSRTRKDATKEISSTLGKLVENIQGQFCYGGVIDNTSTSVVYKTDLPNQWKQLVFPASTEADLELLLRAASVAGFGLGSEQVTDPTYRNALKLDTEEFVTPFCPYSTMIIEEIAGAMVPHIKSIRAELYKLNVYSTGGFFKVHVDTPRSSDMFGSLVICLPSQFKGGELVTRHKGREVIFDWSQEPQQLPASSIKWAAFFSDVEHEILPVTSGHRITLTYNLYNAQPSMTFRRPTMDHTLIPLYSELQAALNDINFMTDGGVLGFATHHTYIFPDLNDEKMVPLLLKGADRILFQMAMSLGLEVMVKPIIEAGSKQLLLPAFPKEFMSDSDELDSYFTTYEMDGETDLDENEEEGLQYNIEYLFEVKPCHIGKITWCDEHKLSQAFRPASATARYGNEYYCDFTYQAAAILVGIPHWDEESNSRSTSAGNEVIRKYVNFCKKLSQTESRLDESD